MGPGHEQESAIKCIKDHTDTLLTKFEKRIEKDNIGAQFLCAEYKAEISGIQATLFYFGFKAESEILSNIFLKLIDKDVAGARELLEKL